MWAESWVSRDCEDGCEDECEGEESEAGVVGEGDFGMTMTAGVRAPTLLRFTARVEAAAAGLAPRLALA
jgi:hypothetical protein